MRQRRAAPSRAARAWPGGTILGRGRAARGALSFEIRPAGRGAPRINPKPILDGWKLLESTAIYRAAGKNPLLGRNPSIGRLFLMSKTQLQRHVLANRRIDVYGCGAPGRQGGHRRPPRAGHARLPGRQRPQADRHVAAVRPQLLPKGGSVSHHSHGAAVDISAINGVPIIGHQGSGSIADMTVRRLLTLQGVMKPAPGHQPHDLRRHRQHVRDGRPRRPHPRRLAPLYGPNTKLGRRLAAVLKPKQWVKLIDRIAAIENPAVQLKLSRSR